MWDRVGAGDKLNATIALLGVIAVVVFGIFQLTATDSGTPKTPPAGGGTTTNHTTTTPTTTKPQLQPSTYLTTLHLKAGDVPENGKVEVEGRELRKSIYWEKVGLHTSLSGRFCEANNECRAVTYDLDGKYNTFEAEVGGTISLYPSQAYNGHWWVVVDGKVTQGTFALNRLPRTVLVSVSHAHTLELRLTAEGEETEPTLVWGDARVW
jgi:hypothetical protein